MKKRVFYTELSYVLGVIILAFNTAVMEKGDFGVSMVVAPAYLLYLKVSEFLPFFTFGMAEYVFQAVMLTIMCLTIRKFKVAYLFSFVTTILYGIVLDASMILMQNVVCETLVSRIIIYILGIFGTTMGVSLLFHTYISPAVYELFVKEVSSHFNKNITTFKIAYDYTSCIVAILMSFLFFGLWNFEGVKIGTVVCALFNGLIISMYSKIFEGCFTFKDKFNFRKYF